MSISKHNISVALVYKHSVFISRRSKDSNVYPNKWQFPGGKLGETENPIDGAMREVEEETGLKIDIRRFRFLGTIVEDPTLDYCYVYCVELYEGEYPKRTEPDKMGNWHLFRFDTAIQFDLLPGLVDKMIDLRNLYNE